MVTDEQVRLLRKKRMNGKTQEAAAAAAGMSARSARKWEKGGLPSESKSVRHWRTRADPFEEVWESKVVPLLEPDLANKLEAKTVIEELIEAEPSKFDESQLRTLQRRFRDWRALHGPEREVFFEQEHPPGRQGHVDFTEGKSLGVTVMGQPLLHLLFVFRLAFSGWTWATLAVSETFEALVGGIQGALWELGGSPEKIRSDNLSAATHELKKAGGRGFNRRYTAVLEHYGVEAARIKPGHSNQNGIVEKGHDLLKSRIEQALQIRGSRDFGSREDYLAFVRLQTEYVSRRGAGKLDEERHALQALPDKPVPSYSTYAPKVRRHSTVRVGGRNYSVPSRLIGHTVEVRQHAETVEVFYKNRLVETFPRLRGEATARIDYRHVIWSLVRKPGAFAQYRYRDEMFPTDTFRAAYGAFKTHRGERADIEYVRVLHLAASTMESTVERALQELLAEEKPFVYADVKDRASPRETSVPAVQIGQPDLVQYDTMLEMTQ